MTRTTLIPGLKNGTEYEFGVYATATDGATSKQDLATATPNGDIGSVNRSPTCQEPAGTRENKPRCWSCRRMPRR